MVSKELVTPEIPDQGRVYDEDNAEWDSGWQTCFKRQKVVVFINAQVFNDVVGSVTSEPFKCAPYRFAEVFLDVVKVSTPTDIRFLYDSSPDGIDWYEMAGNNWTSNLFTATGKYSIYDRVISPYFRVRAVATGTTASAYFTANVKAVFSG